MAKWNKGRFHIVPPEDIRAEPISYPLMVIRAFNRVLFLTYPAVEKDNAKSLQALESSIRMLHAVTIPYHNENYTEEANKIQDKLKKIDIRKKNYFYFIKLQKWVEELAKLFREMDLIPAKKIKWKAGEGPVTDKDEF